MSERCKKKAPKEYKSRHDWGGKVIRWELYNGKKSVHVNKWYMLKTESHLKMRWIKFFGNLD